GKEYTAVAQGPYGLSFPIPRAISGSHTQVIQALLASGADVNVKDINGFTPLIGAAATGKMEIVDVLLKHGADPNARSYDVRAPVYGRGKVSALILASISGFADIVQILMDHGANVNAVDDRGDSAIYYSAWHGHTSTVKALLRAQDIDVNSGKFVPLLGAIGIGKDKPYGPCATAVYSFPSDVIPVNVVRRTLPISYFNFMLSYFK
ncbi:MAG TPA: ankyrin repeat domain-containing protein, partial [Candidatus Aminicenantes bacterium]|nr:ankyrin repeat domain-containing protein [Candidatus Aminicenantes bacterium]